MRTSPTTSDSPAPPPRAARAAGAWTATDAFREDVHVGRRFAEAGDYQAAERHFRRLLEESRGGHAGNHVLATKSLITLYGRGGRYLETHMLARRLAQRAREAGPTADVTLAFALGAVCGALSELELVEPLGFALDEMRTVLDRSPTRMVNAELGFHAAAVMHARVLSEFERAREHLGAYAELIREARVESVFHWSLSMLRAKVAYLEGDHAGARALVAVLGKTERTPPFHRLKELALTVAVCASLGDVVAGRAAGREALAILESVHEQSGLASGRIHAGSLLARALERLGEVELAARVHDLVAAAVLLRLRQVDECTRELPELGLDDDDSHAILTQFRQHFVRDQRALLRRVAALLAARGDAYVQDLLARSTPNGMVAICAWCESVRPSDGRWLPLGHYIPRDGGIEVTHTICPPCARQVQASWNE